MTVRKNNPIDKLRAMVENERIRYQAALDLLEELDPDSIEQLGDALSEMASSIRTAQDAVESWNEAERDYKADERDNALTAIEEVCNAAEFAIGEVTVPDFVKDELIRGPMDEENADIT